MAYSIPKIVVGTAESELIAPYRRVFTLAGASATLDLTLDDITIPTNAQVFCRIMVTAIETVNNIFTANAWEVHYKKISGTLTLLNSSQRYANNGCGSIISYDVTSGHINGNWSNAGSGSAEVRTILVTILTGILTSW